MAKDTSAVDERLNWIKQVVEKAFKGLQGKKVDQFVSKADNVYVLIFNISLKI